MPNLPEINFGSMVPVKGHNFHDEIACYSLPYGALGFASHFLTYYTLACLWRGRSPLFPWRRLECGRFSLALGATALTFSTGVAVFTMIKCKNTWQLLVIAVWKLSMSLLNGITVVHIAWIMRNPISNASHKSSAFWVILYIPGMIAGMAGLMSLIIQNRHDSGVMNLTIGFYTVIGFGVIIFGAGLFQKFAQDKSKLDEKEGNVLLWGLGGFAFSSTAFTVLAAFFGDWALGMMTHNLVGLPSGDNSILFWTYFVAKRLTMFTW